MQHTLINTISKINWIQPKAGFDFYKEKENYETHRAADGTVEKQTDFQTQWVLGIN